MDKQMTVEQLNILLHKDVIYNELVNDSTVLISKHVIDRWLKEGYDIRPYKKYKTGQLYEIKAGLDKGLDVSLYDNIKFRESQMKRIREGLELGLDVTCFANPKYNAGQMAVITSGLRSGVDISKYLDYNYDAFTMELIQMGLNKGIDISSYVTYNLSTAMRRSIKALLLDSTYFRGMSEEIKKEQFLKRLDIIVNQDNILKELSEEGYIVLDKQTTHVQSRKELSKNVVYTLRTLPSVQQRYSIVHQWLNKGFDIRPYKDYGVAQLFEIWLGFNYGLDVTKYDNIDYNYNKMQEIRKKLMTERETSC